MRDRNLGVDGVARRNGAALQHFTITSDGDLGRRRPRALVFDAIDDGLRLADDAEARRRYECDAAVAFVAGAGDQRMNRGVEAERCDFGGDVMNTSVGGKEPAGGT